MPFYKAPLEDFKFLYHEFLDLDECRALPSMAEATPDVIDAVLEEAARISEEVLLPLNEVGDREGCTFRRRQGRHADRIQRGLQGLHRRRLDGADDRPGIRRPGPAELRRAGAFGNDQRRQSLICRLPGADPRRLRGDSSPRHRCAEKEIPATHGRGPLDRHHEPDRVALRHRSRDDPHPRRKARRRPLQHLGHQDLDLGRRARHGRQHHSPGARPHARRPGRHARHQPVHRAEVSGQRGRRSSANPTACAAAASTTRWACRPRPPAK